MIYTLCLIFATMLASGQILFKSAANYINEHINEGILIAALSWQMLAAVTVYASATILWIYILTRIPLSVAYPFSLAGSAIVVIASSLIYSEPMTIKYIIGISMIFGGLILINY